MAERVSFRLGTAADLETLRDIDTDASSLFEEAGLFLDLPETHEFSLAERRRWQECLAARTTLIAVDPAMGPIGFAAVGRRDGRAYLAQLSVRRYFMGLGIGGALLESAAGLASGFAQELWLTTYAHLAWNRPFYERHRFVVMPPDDCGAELLEEHRTETKWLPFPEQRVVMRRHLR